jgi:hypothetical protein
MLDREVTAWCRAGALGGLVFAVSDPSQRARQDAEIPKLRATRSLDCSPWRATAITSRRNSIGDGVGMLLILPPRTSSSQARSQLNPGQTQPSPKLLERSLADNWLVLEEIDHTLIDTGGPLGGFPGSLRTGYTPPMKRPADASEPNASTQATSRNLALHAIELPPVQWHDPDPPSVNLPPRSGTNRQS